MRYIDSYFKMLTGYSPTFTSYNGGVYEMDLTRTAVNSFATHCSKLKPEIEGRALKRLEKTIQQKPNYFMDTTKFIKRVATYVAVEHTAFIVPIEDEYGTLCGCGRSAARWLRQQDRYTYGIFLQMENTALLSLNVWGL